MTPQQTAQACADTMWHDDNASRHLGMSIVQVMPGSATLQMPITSQMTNGHGTCHGGYIFTLADSAFAFACNSYNQRNVAQHTSITFIRPALHEDLLTAICRQVSRTRRSGIFDVAVTNQHGKPIAEFRGHCRAVEGQLLAEQQDEIHG